MSTNVDFMTANTEEVFTENKYFYKTEDDLKEDEIEEPVFSFLLPISVLEDVVMALVIYCIGITLNAIILRCY